MLSDLARLHPWPKTKPVGSPTVRGWHLPIVQKALLPELPKCRVILELGVYHGESTRWFCDNSGAMVIAVDHFQGSPHMKHDAGLRGELGLIWETFCAASWDYRDRIIPMRMDTVEAMHRIYGQLVDPDLIYLDASHETEPTRRELTTILNLFPGAKVYGDDYNWTTVKAAVDAVATERDLDLWNNGRVWWIRK